MRAWIAQRYACVRTLWLYGVRPELKGGNWEPPDYCDAAAMPLTRDQFPDINPAAGEVVEVELTAREVRR